MIREFEDGHGWPVLGAVVQARGAAAFHESLHLGILVQTHSLKFFREPLEFPFGLDHLFLRMAAQLIDVRLKSGDFMFENVRNLHLLSRRVDDTERTAREAS